MNHFFNSSTVSASSKFQPTAQSIHEPSISFTAIFHGDDILVFDNFEETQITQNDKLSKIGLIKGIAEFSCKFDDSSHVKYIDTEKQRFVIASLTENGDEIMVVLCLNLGFVIVDTETGKVEYTTRNIAKSEYLMNLLSKGLKNFQLNYGCILANRDKLPKWWHEFITRLFKNKNDFNYMTNGLVSMLNTVKKSSLRLPSGFKLNLDLKISSILNTDDNLLHVSVMNLVQDPFENYGLIYSCNEGRLEDSQVSEVIQYLQFVDLHVGLDTQSITSDNLISRPVKKIANTDETIPINASNPLMNFLADPLTPMVYDPLNATVDAVNTVGSYFPSSLKFWGNTSTEVQQETTLLNGDENITVDEQEKWMFYTGDNGKDVHLGMERYKLVLYKVHDFLISMVYKNFDKSNYKNLGTMLRNEIYELYLSDIKTVTQQEAFQYLIVNKTNYYSSMPLIDETTAATDQIQLNNSILNFVNGVDFKLNRESIFKNSKNYWIFYHHNVEISQKILLIKRNEIEEDPSQKNQRSNDLKKLFMTNPTIGDSTDDEIRDDEFVSTLGNDVLSFWKSLSKVESEFR